MIKILNTVTRPLVAWITVDSLRPEFLSQFRSCLAACNETELELDTGIIFSAMKASGPYTLPAMGASFTGQLPPVSGLDSWICNVYQKFNNDCISIFEVAKNAGYQTSFLMGRGRDFFPMYGVDELNYFSTPAELDHFMHLKLDALSHPQFIYAHVDWLHDKRIALGIEGNTVRYGEAVSETAEKLARLVSDIRSRNGLLIISSDHGMVLEDDKIGRHREPFTGTYLSNKSLNCFAWFSGMDDLSYSTEDTRLCSSVDMFSTVSSLLGTEIETLGSINLLKTVPESIIDTDQMTQRSVFSLAGGLHQSPHRPNAYCVQNEKFKLVKTDRRGIFRERRSIEIYNMMDDPDEVRDLASFPYTSEIQIMTEALDEFINAREATYRDLDNDNVCRSYCTILSTRTSIPKIIRVNSRIQQALFLKFRFSIAYQRLKTRVARFIFLSHEI